MLKFLEGKKTYIAAAAMAIAVIVLYFYGQADAAELATGLTAAAAFCGLSAKLNRWLPDLAAIIVDAKSKDLKGAAAIAITDAAKAAGTSQS